MKWKEDGKRKASRVAAIPQISNYASLSADPAARPTNHSTHVPTYSLLPASLPAPSFPSHQHPPLPLPSSSLTHSSSSDTALLTPREELLVVRSPALRFSISLVILYGYSTSGTIVVLVLLKPPSHSPCAVTNSTHTLLPPRPRMSLSNQNPSPHPGPQTAPTQPNPSILFVPAGPTVTLLARTHADRKTAKYDRRTTHATRNIHSTPNAIAPNWGRSLRQSVNSFSPQSKRKRKRKKRKTEEEPELTSRSACFPLLLSSNSLCAVGRKE